jgi:hypothetical protein
MTRRRAWPSDEQHMEATATTRGMHDAATNTWLSPTQLAAWKADGMIVLEDMFSAQEMDEMRAEADNILETQISSSLYHKRRSGRLDWRVREDGKQLIRKIQPINDMSLTFATVSTDPRMKGPLAQLMGEPAVLFEEKLNYKHPLMRPAEGLAELDMSYSNALEGVKPDSDWGQHNDYAYYIANGYPMESISSALVLDDCTLENGCLIMWPGSHIQHRIHDANPELGA